MGINAWFARQVIVSRLIISFANPFTRLARFSPATVLRFAMSVMSGNTPHSTGSLF
jgi:hypothetical protein